MIVKTRYRIALILLAAVILLVGTYFLLDKVIFKEDPVKTTYDPPAVMVEGEYFNQYTGMLALFGYEETKTITSFRVHNAEGDYRLVYSDKFEQLRLENYEGLYLQNEITSTMLAYACIPNTNGRITDGSGTYTVRYENGQVRPNVSLTQYGLAEEDDPAYYEMTIEKTVNGEKTTTVHKVYLGNLTPLGNAYYCRYEGRNEIYTIGMTFQYIKLGMESLLVPLVVQTQADAGAPWLDRISIAKYGELKIEARYQSENSGISSGRIYSLTHPVAASGYEYEANVSLFGTICTDFIQLVGDRVMEVISREPFYNTETGELDSEAYQAHRAEVLKKYGLSSVGKENPYTLVYGWDGISDEDLGDLGAGGDITQEGTSVMIPMFISEKTETGTYYVFSIILGEDGHLYEQIVEIQASAMPYLEYETISFIDPSVFFTGIVNIDKIAYKGNYTDEKGNVFSADEVFWIRHDKKTTVNSSGETEETPIYGVECLNSGVKFAAESTETSYFGALYTITTYSPSYVGTADPADVAKKEWVADITFTLLPEKEGEQGQVLTFSYYRISSTMLGVSLDGGEHIEFTVHYSGINDILANVNRVVNGQKLEISRSNQMASIPNINGK